MISASPAAQRPLRIALLGYRSHPHVGGQGIYLRHLSCALVELGHSVDVLSGPPYPELDPRVRLIPIPSLDLYAHPQPFRALRLRHICSWADLSEWWSKLSGGFGEPYSFGRRLLRHLREQGSEYDLIHDNQSLCYALLTLQKQGLAVVATVHHPITQDRDLALAEAEGWGHRLLIKRWYSFLTMQRRVVQGLRHVVSVSECARRDVAAAFDKPLAHIAVIGNGVDTERFQPAIQQNPTQQTKVPGRIITTTSSDQPLKGFAVLLRALVEVRKHLPHAHLRVIGKLNPQGRNQILLHELGLQDVVTFCNGLSEAALVEEYHQASVAVCPSLYEGFGLPAAEALACGVPLVSSDGGALAEVVGDAGLLVPAGDSAAMANALQQVLGNRVLAQAMSHKGRQRAIAHFCWRRVAEQMTDYYRRCVLTGHLTSEPPPKPPITCATSRALADD